MNGPDHDKNLFKVMMEQSKAMKLTWLTACWGGAGCIRFQGAKKHPAKGEDLNALVSNSVKLVPITNKRLKAKASSDSRSEDKQYHFNFETLKIG